MMVNARVIPASPLCSGEEKYCEYVYMLMRDAEGRKKERSKQGQTNNKAKQYSTPKAVSFPNKNELPRVAFACTCTSINKTETGSVMVHNWLLRN